MARTDSFDIGSDSGAAAKQTVISAAPGEAVNVSDAAFISNSEILRDGQDLILQAPDGSEVIIEGYFAMEPAPAIAGPGGAMLTPELVESFVRSANPQFAANAQANDESPVGAVQEVKGTATVTRADGSVETVTVGTVIYQGDIVETEGDGAVNIVFIDETSFAISENAKMAIDEYVFDPSTESGTTNFSVLRGMFVFTSGLIGRDDPDDVEIDTPVGSIGIRGTTIAGNLNTGEITVVEGAIVLRGHDGQEVTLATQFETGRFNAASGTVEVVGVLDGKAVSLTFIGMGPVVPAFFAAIGVTPTNDSNANTDASPANEPAGNSNDAPAGETNTPAPDGTQTQDQSAAPEAAPQPLNADLSMDVAATSNPFEQANEFGTAAGTTATSTTEPLAPAPATASATTTTATASAPPATTTVTEPVDTSAALNPPPPPPAVVAPVTPPAPNSFAPVLTAATTFNVAENSAMNTSLSAVLGTDADGNALTYSLTGGGGLFAVSGGAIVVNGALDFEAVATHTITVTVTDGVFTATETYTVNITDQNDPSVFTSATSATVAETATPGSALYTATATDQDAGGITYALSGAPGGFTINATTGVVTSTAAAIDSETVGGSVTFDIVATQGGVGVTQTVTLNITNMNDTAPTVTINNGAVNEGATLTLTAAMLQAADVDTTGAVNLVYTVSTPTAGQVQVSGAPSTTFTQDDINNNRVTFVHDGSNGGTAAFNFTVSDGTNVLGGQTFGMTVTQINNAPVLGAATPALTGTVEDTTSSSNTVSTIMTGTVTDDETAAGSIGMAITATDSSNGTWQYYNVTLAGWQNITGVSNGNALLLNSTDVVRFVPNADYNGTATFSYKAWDGSAGTRYGTEDSTAGTAFSATTNTASMTISAVNDAPVVDLDTLSGGTGATANFTEGTPVFIVGSNISVNDLDSPIGSMTVTILTPPNGTYEKLIYGGTAQYLTDRGITLTGDETGTITLTGSGLTTAANYAEVLQLIRYNNFYDTMAAGARTINVTAFDGALISAVATITVNVTPVTDNDVFMGSAGVDNFVGDAGDDTVYVSAGEDTVDGGGGTDTLNFSNATTAATVSLVSGNLTNAGFGAANYYIANFENVVGSNYNDTISGNGNNNVLIGGAGNDTISGSGGTDTLQGGAGDDTFYVSPSDGDLTISGGTENDTYNATSITGAMTLNLATGVINRGAWVDTVTGVENFSLGTGADVAKIAAGAFNINGGAGIDTLDFSALGADIWLDLNNSNFTASGVDLVHSGFENAIGTAYNDTFTGNSANNRFEGGAGNDTFMASAGNNEYIGGTQSTFDTVDYSAASAALNIDMTAGSASANGFGGADVLTGIERIIGSSYNDMIKGKAGVAESLMGGAGADTFFIQENDSVSGGAGNDSFTIGTAFNGMNLDGNADMDTLHLGATGNYDFANFGNLSGVEFIDATSGANNVVMDIDLTGSMLSALSTKILTINMNAGDTLNLDFSAFSGGNQFVMTNNSAGTMSYYSAGLDRTVTINHASGVNVTGLGAGGILNLNSIGAGQGYVMHDNLGLGFGYSMAAAGDLNGDMIDDFVVTRAGEQTNGTIAMFAINGTSAAVGNTSLGAAGGRVDPMNSVLSQLGIANNAVISSIQDWDGDGVNDFIVGVYAGDSPDGFGGESIGSGAVQVISGDNGALLTELAEADTNAHLGRSVSGAGDINGDGYMDFVVGSPLAAAAGGTDAGKAYIIFGGATIPTEIGLTSSSPSEVRVIQGTMANGHLGQNVQGIGDFNNDGYDDFAISEAASGTGRMHVIFGSTSPGITLGTTTFTINDVAMGAGGTEIPLYAMGDINGDGVADMGVGSMMGGTGALHLFFGGLHGAGTNSMNTDDVTIVTGNANVKMIGAGAVGDFNADGVDDFGVAMMNTSGSVVDMYVVYGGTLSGTLDQSFLNNAANAFHISYTVPLGTDTANLKVNMNAIGDVNGDGFADLGIGVSGIDSNVSTDSNSNAILNDDKDGMVAVIYGSASSGANIQASGTSTASGQTLLGTAGTDSLVQNSASHTGLVFRGGGGDDVIGISANSMTSVEDIDGGAGWDRLEFMTSGQTLNFTGITAENFKGIDEISFAFGQTNQTIRLSLQQIFTIIENSDSQVLWIEQEGGTGTLLQIDDGTGASFGTISTASAFASALGLSELAHDANHYNFYQGDNVLSIATELIDNSQVQII